MATWTAGDFVEQVQLLTGNNGLGTRILNWLNRVIMETSIKVPWNRQVISAAGGGAAQTTGVLTQWFTVNDPNFIAFNHFQYGTTCAPVQVEAAELYQNFHGQAANVSTATIHYYAVPKWTASGTNYMVPQVALYPIATTATTAFTLHYQQAPNMVTSPDSNWMMEKYPHVILAGTLAYAKLYLGDANGYLAQMAAYANGVRDMILTEESPSASTPQMRGVYPESMNRLGGA
jgi:hypothetical protein